jgi:putative nucleotidyltransferase with HDIG domain
VRLFVHVQQLYRGTLKALARAIDAKSEWTQGHSERVTRTAVRLARQLGLREAEIQVIDRGGQLHDIGKIGVPSTLLDKAGALTAEERKTIEAHAIIGERILEPIPGFEDVIPIVGQHHEWYDGGGYPRGLRGEEIHWYARILAVADSYDALRSDRPYRAAIIRQDVLEYIVSRSGTQFDPRVVEAFVKIVPTAAGESASPVVYL